MTPALIREKVLAERCKWVREMLNNLRSLPTESPEIFRSDPRNFPAAESYLRRALEAVLDLGRHLLAKGFGEPVAEYKQIGQELRKFQVLSEGRAKDLQILAGYRNRMVHFYDEISDQEIYEIITRELGDIEGVLEEISKWVKEHPDMIDRSL